MLRAHTFYGVIATGVALGTATAAGGAWAYVTSDAARPDGRWVLADVAEEIVVPVAAMMGATFGGMAGVTVAVALDRLKR